MTREITITPVLNGFICKVGCQKVVFQSVGLMTSAIEAYYKNPEDIEQRYIKEAVNKMDNGPQCEPCGTAEVPREDCIRPAPPMNAIGQTLARR